MCVCVCVCVVGVSVCGDTGILTQLTHRGSVGGVAASGRVSEGALAEVRDTLDVTVGWFLGRIINHLPCLDLVPSLVSRAFAFAGGKKKCINREAKQFRTCTTVGKALDALIITGATVADAPVDFNWGHTLSLAPLL